MSHPPYARQLLNSRKISAMKTRLAVLDLVARAGLDDRQASRLWQLAGFGDMPPRMLARVRMGITLAGAGCAGLGLIFWVAANWSLLSRWQQFTLLQALVLVPCAVAAAFGRAPAVAGLLALVCTGGLFAYFGQTYQTGADPWQLFALWAVLTLPLACCARSDVVWSAWAVVGLVAIALWDRGHMGFMAHQDLNPGLLRIAGTSWAAGLTIALSKITRRYTGAGDWAFGVALVLTATWATGAAIQSLWDWAPQQGHYWFVLLVAGSSAGVLARHKPFDVFSTSVLALGINVLLVAGLWKLLLDGSQRDWIGGLLMVGLFAAGLLAGSVSLMMSLQRASALPKEPRHNQEERA